MNEKKREEEKKKDLRIYFFKHAPLLITSLYWMISKLNVALVCKLRVSLMCLDYFLTYFTWVYVQPGTGRHPVLKLV